MNFHKALGEALFSVVGGRIQGELVYQPLCWLEHRVSAYRYGLPLQICLNLLGLMKDALEEGVVDQVREGVLHQCYPPENCNQLHEQGSLNF